MKTFNKLSPITTTEHLVSLWYQLTSGLTGRHTSKRTRLGRQAFMIRFRAITQGSLIKKQSFRNESYVVFVLRSE